ncbi:1-deoxy-D-xylulose-5-phosphate reductoisomerase [Pusillimonas sp. CC-YST705]|uniref:1-deoxy-D-xylulose 5-phosphate reductoisomerase n=1 Tax=Mesopusillimonas faecipullorum TaxID=2755040 RepID=A0ABS8CAQ9_9BURK|nr:1-deoxy-D-xylulose-5-phosphate reductoisomerase [Mesopusillimonas faecipullorum]MCB5363115.1 1-deoxy-D-xylulose-5-phosphate reductoisomerase [Mesopusillimonas faecipullorum]
MTPRCLCILGATGSIGESTLDVVRRHPERFQVYALSAHSRMERLAELAAQTGAKLVAVPDDAARLRFIAAWPASGIPLPEILLGPEALEACASADQVDTVMAAIVGAAGLPSALAAARAGKRVLLANKEALVAAGGLFMQAVRDTGAELLPIDSEHNAIFQCLPQTDKAFAPHMPAPGVRRLLLTASGGPFRTLPIEQLAQVTPDQACAHPNWEMGRKISVDSATMLNKGLEVIEAHWLFAMPPDRIQVVIHPQSMVHSMVEYDDGSILAQLGQPDMRTPIAYGLGFPERIDSGVGLLDLATLGRLDFEPPDLQRFPCLALSFQALRSGQDACIVLNAANEVAVAGFLAQRLPFTGITRCIEESLSHFQSRAHPVDALDAILDLDAQVRRYVAGRAGR